MLVQQARVQPKGPSFERLHEERRLLELSMEIENSQLRDEEASGTQSHQARKEEEADLDWRI